MNKEMNFSQALKCLKLGSKVQRNSWNGNGIVFKID